MVGIVHIEINPPNVMENSTDQVPIHEMKATYAMFGSLEGRRVVGRRVEGNGYLHLVWMFLKLMLCLEVWRERRGEESRGE